MLQKKGLTAVEIIVVVAVLALIALTAIFSFSAFRTSSQLNAAQDTIITTLRLARSRTIASQGLQSWGVHFDQNQAVLFPGLIYNPADPQNTGYGLPVGIEIVNDTLSSWPDITFARISGEANSTGRIAVRPISLPLVQRKITIRPFADLSQAPGLPAQIGTRVTDTRHVHFNLGWSIRGAETLTLAFQDNRNQVVTHNINMAPYFSGGPPATSFDWSGSFSIDGKDQRLHILTHFLDASNTILSVQRNRLDNTKPVSITIVHPSLGPQLIATYAANGDLTVGPAGGTATIQ